MNASTPRVLRDYAFLGDGERGAVVGPDGEVVWLCAPRWDSDAVFSSLIGGPGQYVVCPQDDWNVWGGYYEDGTLIRVNRWVTGGAVIECREALAVPTDPDRLLLLRRIRAVRGDAWVRVLLDPRPGFGDQTMHLNRADPDSDWHGSGGGLDIRWKGAGQAVHAPGGGLRAQILVPEGAQQDLVLEISAAGSALGQDTDAARLWRSTELWWRDRVPDCADLPAGGDARHAYAVLNGLAGSAGGMAAAATTSLPERADAGRNYDYRYSWLRDHAYAGIAVAAHGPHPLLDGAVSFTAARVLEHGDRLRPVYRVNGGDVPEQRALPLPGYPGGADRIGNQAAEQFQLDTFGEALQLFAAAARHDRLDDDARRAVDVAVDAVRDNWLRPDAGVWELEPRWWTHSRLSVVTGLRGLATALPGPSASRWSDLADGILAETRRRCLRPDGAWGRADDDPGADGAMLMPLSRGCVPDEDPSIAATHRLIAHDLSEHGFVYRFRHRDEPLGAAEGAFLLCGFMMAAVACRIGDRVAAYRWFERTRSAYGPPGLFCEEYDVAQRQLRGNLPQAFVHAALLESAARLSNG